MAYIFLQQYQKALDDINKAIALAPGSPDDYALRAGIYEAMGEIAKAKEDRTRAQQLSGVSTLRLRITRQQAIPDVRYRFVIDIIERRI